MASIVGGRRIALSELVAIVRGQKVVIDNVALDALQKVSADRLRNSNQDNKKKGTELPHGNHATHTHEAFLSVPTSSWLIHPSLSDADLTADASTTAVPYISVTKTRAAIAIRLFKALEGNAALRVESVQFLAHLLNANITPTIKSPKFPHCSTSNASSSPIHCELTADKQLLHDLAAYLHNDHSFLSQLFVFSADGQRIPYLQALHEAQLSTPGISPQDLDVFTNTNSFSLASACLDVYSISALLNVADCIAALSLEAISGDPEPFSTFHSDVLRPHKGQVQVATHIRHLIEGSKLVGTSKRSSPDPEAFRYIPQYHGPAYEIYEQTAKTVKIEMTASEPLDSSKYIGAFHPQPLVQALAQLHVSVLAVASGSVERTKVIIANYESLGLSDGLRAPQQQGDVSWETHLSQITHLLQAAHAHHFPTLSVDPYLVARVFSLAVRVLHDALSFEVTVSLQAIGIKDIAIIEANTAALAAKEEAQKKREEELKAKGVKIKDNKKKADGTGGREVKGLTLGNGTSEFRSFLLSYFTPVHTNEQLAPTIDAMSKILDPLTAPANLRSFLRKLLEHTNQISKPKIPKGARDSTPEQIVIRDKAFSMIKGVFLRHGAVGIDTPVFELKETLTNKYGEDSKLIYDLADQGGEILALRYDLTVPFARYLATYGIEHIKRYHIGRVYRRDNPAMSRGRFREFYQCDLDIAGMYASMVPDSECLAVLNEILSALPIGGFKIKLNHRKLLDAIMGAVGVPAEKFRPICSAIDKLDKESWATVKEEMVVDKGLAEAVADRIGEYVSRIAAPGSSVQLLEELEKDATLASTELAKVAFEELRLLFIYTQAFGCSHKISLDLSLARGLDYYTGVIYEAVLTDTDRVGSIAAGGRYDNLVGMFSGKTVPAVGVSIGIERIFTILEEAETQKAASRNTKIRKNASHVFVASIGDGMIVHRIELCRDLWAAGINAEMLHDSKPKMDKQLKVAQENSIPFMVVIGEDEVKNKQVKLKKMDERVETTENRDDLVKVLTKLISELPVDSY